MDIIVPVYWIDRDGQVGTDFINGSPCVLLTIADRNSGISRNVYGMLDTGADSIWVDDQIVVDLAATAASYEKTYTANSQYMAGVYEGDFRFEGIAGILTSRYLTSALRSNNRKYDVILGRAVLSHFRLVIDGPKRAAALVYPSL